jgi:hypothetical protein
MRFIKSLTLITCIMLLAATASMAQTPPERLTGRIVNTGSGGGSAHFTLQIDQLTPDAEMARLRTLLEEKGEQDVIKSMEKMPVIGWLRVADSIRYNVAVIESIPIPDGGRIIRVVTNRSLAFGEVMHTTRSRKYRFGIVEVMLGPDGTGEGSVLAAARFNFNKEGDLEIESYGIGPVQVLNVQTKPGDGK